MAKRPLTPKQEEFTRLYFKLGNATEAYKQSAYASTNMKESTITRNAHELLCNNNVLAMLDGLKEKATNHSVITKQTVLDRLSEIGMEDDRDRVAAYKQISKILGFDAPIQQDITITSPFSKYLTDKESDGS